MPRPRAARNRSLPDGLRCRRGYYSYTSRADGKEVGLGRDRAVAIQQAMRRNQILRAPLVALPDFTLSNDQILAESVPVEQLNAVYFLLHGHEIVYVGQSTNVHARIAQHIALGAIKFDRFHILPCPKDCLLVLEAQYILAFNPRHNKSSPVRSLYPVPADGGGE